MDLWARTSRIWSPIERWLNRDRISFFCFGLLGFTLVLMVISFLTSDENHQTWFGNLGQDFAGFYYAGKILNGPTPENLYDPGTQDEAYYDIFPTLREKQNLPYIHPPLVAWTIRALATLPYPAAFAVWLVISAVLYAAGLALTCQVLPSMPAKDRNLAILLALTFEPFLMECWLGGQLSAVAFVCLALAFYWEQSAKPVQSGLALGLLLYKPTLVFLLLAMLLVGRRWRTLLGVGLTGLFLGLVSLLAVGKSICFSWINALRGFSGTATGSGLVLKDFKFIDLNFFFRNLFDGPTTLGKVLVLLIAAGPLVFLIISWWNLHRGGENRRRLIWAGTVTWTMVINVYVGIYDMILVVPALLWTADVFYQPQSQVKEYFPTFKLFVFLVAVVSWMTQAIAERTGFQMITLVLFTLAAFQLFLAWKATVDGAISLPNSADLSKT